ncbi:MAG: tRNA lysidine(34) synthetase TilS [[Clostridium] scindens]
MYHKVKAYIEKYHMLDEKDKVIVGVSGGADSICLLFMLIELKKEMGLSVEAVHVHHGLRKEIGGSGCGLCTEGMQRVGIELPLSFYEDVKSFALYNKMSEEEAGRYVRRRIFKEVLKEAGGTKIALAHHQNDNAETLLWNLCRGCSLKGMGGIAPVDGVFIRPLLSLKREEIESYLVNRGISYCTDETNLEDGHTRNRIRNHVIPYLEEQVNERAVSHMSETMEQMRQLWKYVESETTRYAARCIKVSGTKRGGYFLSRNSSSCPRRCAPMCFMNLYARRPGGAKTLSRSMQRCCLNCWITKWDARQGSPMESWQCEAMRESSFAGKARDAQKTRI